MAVFVHLTSPDAARRIRRSGLASPAFASPVATDFVRSHQWLREVRRWQPGRLVGVYFRLPGHESLLVGRYGRPHETLTADEAVGRALAAFEPGLEVIVPRRVHRAELLAVRALPQVVGWRYAPEAKGRPPTVCLHCERGSPFVRRLVRQADREGARTRITVLGR